MPRKKVAATKVRASWRGMLRFGLVTFPVQAVNAHIRDEGTVSLHQLHAACHSRIRYEKVCPLHGPVDPSEIVSAYEYRKDRYVEIDSDELQKLRTDREKSLTIDHFINPDELGPLYFDGRMYFLAPDGDSARETYAVFLEALKREQLCGIGQVIFSGKAQVVQVRPVGDALLMALLNFAAEMHEPTEALGELPSLRKDDKNVKLAQQLIASYAGEEFHFADYVDHYRAQMMELIEAKVEGRELVAPEAESEPEVVNLMDALRKSLAHTGSATKKTNPTAKGTTRKRPAKAETRTRSAGAKRRKAS